MTLLLIILAAWALALLFVTALCTMARLGDDVQAHRESAVVGEEARLEIAVGAARPPAASAAPRAAGGHPQRALRVPADIAA